ncbi:MAG: WecB/TagA/CpsF family glycosyltransferase [Planctomycetota bacterium]
MSTVEPSVEQPQSMAVDPGAHVLPPSPSDVTTPNATHNGMVSGSATTSPFQIDDTSARAGRPTIAGDRITVWNVPFDRLDMWQSVDRIDALIRRGIPSYAITANLNYCMLHNRDPQVRRVTREAALILADGQPIVWRSKLSNRKLPERVAGRELLVHLCGRAAQRGYRVYLLGGQPGVADRAATMLCQLHPGLQVAGTESPPYRELTATEHQEQLERIRVSGADVLFVAFGQPKGEKWICENHQALGVPMSIQLGASFDFLAGTAKQAPDWVGRCGLEWAYRMAADPRRLVPRYTSNAAFLAGALVEDWRKQVTEWGMGDWAPIANPASQRRPNR